MYRIKGKNIWRLKIHVIIGRFSLMADALLRGSSVQADWWNFVVSAIAISWKCQKNQNLPSIICGVGFWLLTSFSTGCAHSVSNLPTIVTMTHLNQFGYEKMEKRQGVYAFPMVRFIYCATVSMYNHHRTTFLFTGLTAQTSFWKKTPLYSSG